MSSYSAFQQAVSKASSEVLDRSCGRVYALNGDIFYSPNCQRDVWLPPSEPKPSYDTRIDEIDSLRWPRWWTPTYGYLAFLPTDPGLTGYFFSGYPLHHLSRSEYDHRIRHIKKGGYTVDAGVVLDWNRLQYDLVRASSSILDHSGAPEVVRLIQTVITFSGEAESRSLCQKNVARSQRWFAYWLGIFSYAIAVNETMKHDAHSAEDEVPEWFEYLAKRGWLQAWLSGIRSSVVGTFSPDIPRTGVFIDVAEPQRYQYSVDWLSKFNVPVWYPWGIKEKIAASRNSSLLRLAPLPHQLQELVGFRTKEPQYAPPIFSQTADQSFWPETEPQYEPPIASQPESQISTFEIEQQPVPTIAPEIENQISQTKKPWIQFFNRRKEINERLLKSETPTQKRSRLDREGNPPQKKTRVFVWEENNNGVFVRESRPQKYNNETLADFGRNQKIYDAFSNEWDCCEEFGSIDDDENMEWDDIDEAILPPSNDYHNSEAYAVAHPHPGPSPEISSLSPTVQILESARMVSPSHHPCHPIIRESVEPSFELQNFETTKILYQMFGFVHPLPLPSHGPAKIADTSEQVGFSKLLGMWQPDSEFFASPVAPSALQFMKSLVEVDSRPPSNDSWDLNLGNRISVAGTKRFDCIQILQDGFFFFDFEQESTLNYRIATNNALVALYICRLDSKMDDYEIALHLVKHGIGFCTFDYCPRYSLPRKLSPAPLIPIRTRGYQFTYEDYRAYVEDRSALLANPRTGRCALKRGGIVWRLAMGSVSIDHVIQGPTVSATLHREGLVLDLDEEREIWDDALDQKVLDLLCGLTYCRDKNSKKSPMESWMSWWPTDSVWNANCQHPHWSAQAEHWYQNRLAAINAKTAQPLNSKQWRDSIRGNSKVRRLMSYVTESSERFIKFVQLDTSA